MGNKCLNPFVKIRIFPGGPWGGWVRLDSYDWVVGNDPCWNCPWIFDQTRPWGAKRTVAAWGFSVFFTRDDHVGMTPIDSTKQYQQPLHFDIPSFSTRKSAICFHFERICSMEMARSNDYLMLWDAFGLWLGSAIMIWLSSNLRSEYSSFKARSCYLRCLCLFHCQPTIKVKTSGASCWWFGRFQAHPIEKLFEGLRILKHQLSSWSWWTFNNLFFKFQHAKRATNNQPYSNETVDAVIWALVKHDKNGSVQQVIVEKDWANSFVKHPTKLYPHTFSYD